MSARRARRRQREISRALGILPTPRPGASDAVRLGLRLRAEASLSGRCACGAVAELYEVEADGSLRPAPGMRMEDARPGHAYVCSFPHEPDCPATSPVLERAAACGEIADPAAELFASLRRVREERP